MESRLRGVNAMTIFGRALSTLTKEDLQSLLDRAEAEGRYLEYKEDIPVKNGHDRYGGRGDPDRFWMSKSQINDYGRDKMMRELVAFANADGGILILGIQETEDKPPRAANFNPLPQASQLEDRFRDIIINCIEPRLPSVEVKAVSFDESETGVLLFKVEASRLGPHRVKQSFEATIRREDRCIPLSMSEIHDMVIRNANRFDNISKMLSERSQKLEKDFKEYLLRRGASQIVFNGGTEERIIKWVKDQNKSAFAYRITIVPHQDLGILRLESINHLIRNEDCIRGVINDKLWPLKGANYVWAQTGAGRRILGGVAQLDDKVNELVGYTIRRDGFVEFTLLSIYDERQNGAHVEWFVAGMACVLGIYDRLREQAGALGMPAEISAEILTYGTVHATNGSRSFNLSGHQLDRKTMFPNRTVGEKLDFTALLNETAADFWNAGGGHTDGLPEYRYVDA
jgi:hypothetical protein